MFSGNSISVMHVVYAQNILQLVVVICICFYHQIQLYMHCSKRVAHNIVLLDSECRYQ